MKDGIFRKATPLLLWTLPLSSMAAFAQSSLPVVLRLDGLNSSSTVGSPAPTPLAPIHSLSQSANQRVLPRVIVLPELDDAQAVLPPPAPGQPLWIGVGRALPDAANATAMAGLLAWTQAADGSRRAAISVRAPGAKGLRLGLGVEQLPSGALLRVYAPGVAQTTEIPATEVLRTIQANLDAGDNSPAARTYWLPLVASEEVALEIQLPAGVSPSQLKVSLPAVSHLIMLSTGTEANNGAAGQCTIDATCTSGNQNEIEMRAAAG
jgi:hypothetical protein